MIEPRVEHELRRCFDALIRDVEQLFAESKIHQARSKPETTTLSNLVAVAQTATCLKELELFIQYQAARDVKKWDSDHRFATNLLKRFGEQSLIRQQVKQAVKTLKDKKEGNKEIEEEHLATWLAVQYLGFVRRKYQYLSKFDGGGRHE
jgi:undecaprenyl pyrophosphate synthase